MKKRYKANVDPKDKDSLRRFFEEHYDYTTLELKLKYGIPTSTLNYWRRKVGLSKKRREAFRNYRKKPIKVDKITDPKVWDNGPWFHKMYVEKKIGAYVIARIIDRSATVVYRRLKKFGIDRRRHKDAVATKNKYCDNDWLWWNYIYHHRTLKDMAKEAGVNDYTICNWLTEHGIPLRDGPAYTVIKSRNKRIKAYREKNGTSISKTKREVIKPSAG